MFWIPKLTRPSATTESVLAVAVHKAGSTVFQKILATFAKKAGLVFDPLSASFTKSPLPQATILCDLEPSLHTSGAFYGVVRSPHFAAMKSLNRFRLIAQVRDPRDCLTSHYFSIAYSHRMPKDPAKRDAFIERRRAAESMAIDDFVLQEADLFEERFRRLEMLRNEHPGMVVCKYEDMVERTDKWLAEIARFFGVEMTSRFRRKIERIGGFRINKEDVTKHKRQITPGDHARKLKPKTITVLNSRFSDIMRAFEYDTHVFSGESERDSTTSGRQGHDAF